jgi:tRNA 2-(methylsulfanyl)-N6-isopentenyladenosine37 hydroxylase
MLNLGKETDSRWAAGVVTHLDELLLEHAHLERKAASAALQFMFRYSQHAFLQRPLSELAREELRHFEAVLQVLARRGIAFVPQKPSPYAGRLSAIVRPREPEQLLDRFLCAAVIEARSCERMKILARALVGSDAELAKFYDGLARSEARHYAVYIEFARRLFDAAEVATRLTEITEHEARILADAPDGPRMHNGVRDA